MTYVAIIIAVLAVLAILFLIGAARLNAECAPVPASIASEMEVRANWLIRANAQFRADEAWQEFVS